MLGPDLPVHQGYLQPQGGWDSPADHKIDLCLGVPLCPATDAPGAPDRREK